MKFVKELEWRLEDTEQLLAQAQERSLEAAEALTELGEELAHVLLGRGEKQGKSRVK